MQTTRSHIRDVTARAMAYLSGNMMERRREIIHQWKAVADGPRNAKALADSFQARFDTAHKRLTKLAASNGWNGDISEYVTYVPAGCIHGPRVSGSCVCY